jgi:hypothetical protein
VELFVLRAATRTLSRIVRTIAAGTATLAAAWLAFTYGAGLYAADYVQMVKPDVVASRLGARLVTAHNGFVQSGGRTNIAAPASQIGPRTPAEDPRPVGDELVKSGDSLRGDVGAGGRLETVALGLATMFIPMTLLKLLGVVKVAGGANLFLMTDLDTLFMDLTIAAGAFICFRNRGTWRSGGPYVVFVLSISLFIAITMGYVVTNYGTLVRLRLMVAAPIWSLSFGLCRADGRASSRASPQRHGS